MCREAHITLGKGFFLKQKKEKPQPVGSLPRHRHLRRLAASAATRHLHHDAARGGRSCRRRSRCSATVEHHHKAAATAQHHQKKREGNTERGRHRERVVGTGEVASGEVTPGWSPQIRRRPSSSSSPGDRSEGGGGLTREGGTWTRRQGGAGRMRIRDWIRRHSSRRGEERVEGGGGGRLGCARRRPEQCILPIEKANKFKYLFGVTYIVYYL
jgi:hypothetical protein